MRRWPISSTFRFNDRRSSASSRKLVKSFDPGFERLKGIAKGPVFVGFRALDSSRVGHAPMGGHRVAGPGGADLAGGAVANSEDKIHCRRRGFGKFIPAFAAQVARVEMGLFEKVSAKR